jgi:EmrB/QacA subfamily drug resistance transporter
MIVINNYSCYGAGMPAHHPDLKTRHEAGEAHTRPAQNWVLALTSVASVMVALDILVVTTALTTIRRDLGASIGSLEWTVAAYNVTFAVLLLTGAALGDRFGRRRMFAIGLGVFSLASAGCALAPDVGWLVAGRALEGAGAALIMPLALTLIGSAFPAERRGWALGVFSGVTGLATVAGPLVGGGLVQAVSWQWIFWVNVPVGLITIPLVLGRIQESFGPNAALDVRGMALATGAALGLVWGLIRASSTGWASPEVIAPLAAGAFLAAAFIAWEHRAPHAMVPLRLFRVRSFTAGNAATFFHASVVFGSVFLMAQFLQTAMGYDPLQAGIRMIPWTATLLVAAPIGGKLADRYGERPVIVTGLALAAAGMAWLSAIVSPSVDYLEIVGPLLVSGMGNSLVFAAVQNAVIAAAGPQQLGVSAGVNSMLRELGGVFGIAALAAVFAARGGYTSPLAFARGFSSAIAAAACLAVAGALAGAAVARRRAAPRQRIPGEGTRSGRPAWASISFLDGTDRLVATYPLTTTGRPDLAMVDALAQLRLAMGRLGGAIQVREMAPELKALIDLTGLRQELTESRPSRGPHHGAPGTPAADNPAAE